MPPTPAPVAGALDLRAWALSVLGSPGSPTPPPEVPAGSWPRFLRAEQCALALAARAGKAVGGEGAGVLSAQVWTDTRVVLGARAQLRRVSALAAGAGLRVVVLKGGVPLLRGGDGPRMMDVDLLASPADAAALAARLDAAGHRAVGSAASHRLAVRATGEDLPLEIHTSVPGLSRDVWARVRAVPGFALWVLHPADHLLFLLQHSAVQHADRRGRLRDLLLIAEALAHCAPGEVDEVRAAVAADRHGRALGLQLEMAEGLAARRGPVRDAFELTAAGTYLLKTVLEAGRYQGPLQELAWQAGTAAVARRSGAPVSLGEHGLELPSAVPLLAALRRHAPVVEQALRIAVRRSREWALLPLGLRVAAAAERAVRERAARARPADTG